MVDVDAGVRTPPDQLPIPKFDSKAAANAAYNRIMTQAAHHQQLLNMNVVTSARAGDPTSRAEALDRAIRAGERMLELFREARRVVSAVSPLVPPPPVSTPSGTGFQRPSRVGPAPVTPRTFR